MTLWLLLAAITAVALILIVRPLLREQQGGTSREILETAIYRDRLAEVKRDLERGLLSTAEAEAAEAEISRRMLNVAERRQGAAEAATGQPSRWIAAALVTAVLPLGALVLYLAVGSPDEPGHPFAARQSELAGAAEHGEIDMDEAIQRLAERLKQRPDDLEGWTLLARSYYSEGRFKEAADAYQRAVELSDNDPDLLGAYGETLVAAAAGIITPEALKAFEEVSRIQPDNPAPRFYMGLARDQAGDGRGAMEIWLAIEAEVAPGTPWLPALRQQIERTAAEFGIDPASIAPDRPAPGPSAEDLAAAQSMSGDEQNEMIRSMVARLAERLEQEPEDVEGWLRLAQAYRVLGEEENAVQAVRRAAAASDKAPPELRARLEQMAQDLGLTLSPGQSSEKPSPTQPRGADGEQSAVVPQPMPDDHTQMVQTMVEQLATRLERQPDDAGGWSRLGRSYLLLNQPDKAKAALARAVELDPADPDVVLSYAEATLGAPDNIGPLPERSVEVMRDLLGRDATNWQALWYIGLAEAQDQNPRAAVAFWDRLLAQFDPDTAAYETVKRRIETLN